MTISVSLSPASEAKLREKAAANGQAIDAYISQVLEHVIAAPSADELLAPFRKQVAASGMNDEELDSFFENIREKAYQERQGRHG